jgi:hypothetical protein
MSADADARIDEAAQTLQSLPQLKRALLGREQLITGRVLGREIGKREIRLIRLLSWTGQLGMILVSLLLLLRRLWVQRRLPSRMPIPRALFIGIDALRETGLRQNLRDRLGYDPFFIDHRQMDHFAPAGRLKWFPAIKEWARLIHLALECTREMADDYDRLELGASLTMRLPDLAHLLAQFRALHASDQNILIASSTADLPAHAASVAGFSVEYHQHGFLARSLVFPDFSSMVALTNVEGAHVASRVPKLQAQCPPIEVREGPRRRVLALVGTYGENDSGPVNEIVRFALNQKYQVVIRPHPLGKNLLWQDVRGMRNVMIEADGNFDDFLAKWQPSFLVTWFSTTLLDGLLAGAVPVTLSTGRSNLVFPFDKICISWPHGREELERCMANETNRFKALKSFSQAIS